MLNLKVIKEQRLLHKECVLEKLLYKDCSFELQKLLYKECSLFDVNKDNEEPYVLAHCIASDYGMNTGIGDKLDGLYKIKEVLTSGSGNACEQWQGKGYCLTLPVKGKAEDKTSTVCNLVVKQYVYEKPSYKAIKESLEELKKYMLKNDEKKLAVPLIGCGGDGLNWESVESIIKEVFANTGIEILVCHKGKRLLGEVLQPGFPECFREIEETILKEPKETDCFTYYFESYLMPKLDTDYMHKRNLYKECYKAVCEKHNIPQTKNRYKAYIVKQV